MSENNKLYGYNMNKYLLGNITANNFAIVKAFYNTYFSNSLGSAPYNINLFSSGLKRSYFLRLPNTLECKIMAKTVIDGCSLNNSFINLTSAMNLLGLYANKYSSDFITTNYNYLVDSVNDILIRNYGNNIFRESVHDYIYLINRYNEAYYNGLNTDLFLYTGLFTDTTTHTLVTTAINDIVDGQLSPQIAKLIQSVFLTYNPLYNVDGTESTQEQFNLDTDYTTGDGKVTSEGGHGEYIADSTTDRDLETTNSFNNNLKGSTYDINGTVTKGTDNTSTISGSVLTKNSESTMNDSDFYNTTQTVQSFGKNANGTDTYTTKEEGYNGAYSGTKSTTGRTDATNINITRSKNSNTVSDSTKTSTESPYANVHILTRKGNIGVTKSTDLIDSERKTAIYNVAREVAQLIAHEIFEGVY